MPDRTRRVLIVGRSAAVLRDTVTMLRDRGYAANASNRVDRLLDDYDVREVDLVVFGGMVPPDRKERLRAEIAALSPRVRFAQGLGGIAPLLVGQVEELLEGPVPGVEHDPGKRVLRIPVGSAGRVRVEGLWATFEPPDPVAHSTTVLDDELAPGVHEVPIPAEVPVRGSFAVVRAGRGVSALRIGEPPAAVARLAAGSLPAPEPVTTRLPWR